MAPRTVHGGSVVDIVTLGQAFLRVLWFLLSTIPLLIHIHLCII
jgi:hypothetical protein